MLLVGFLLFALLLLIFFSLAQNTLLPQTNPEDFIEKIIDILPQTQCGKCNYSGCKPYANAIFKDNEHISKCTTGGTTTLQYLIKLTGQMPLPQISMTKPPTQIAKIIDFECIGCMKCIDACPVDAIIGTKKQLHGIISQFCTGCGLCLPVCPVDCIELYSSSNM